MGNWGENNPYNAKWFSRNPWPLFESLMVEAVMKFAFDFGSQNNSPKRSARTRLFILPLNENQEKQITSFSLKNTFLSL